MELDLSILTPQERLSLQLRAVFEGAGYRKYRMGRFEEYGLYQENLHFLSSEQVITFTDLDGRLLALKPDVTLSIAKNARLDQAETDKYYYIENVYRPSLESHTFQEISQMGLECLGEVDDTSTAEVVALALAGLERTERPGLLQLSHMGFVTGLLDAVGAPDALRPVLLDCIRNRNAHTLRDKAAEAGLSKQGIDALCRLLTLTGECGDVLAAADGMALNSAMSDALAELTAIVSALGKQSVVRVGMDLAQVGEMDYYNGLVFRGYVDGLPRAVLQGGRYDPLVARFHAGARAIGFALYLNELDRLPQETETGERRMLSVALPKGRLGDKVYNLLARVGYGCDESYADSRKLVVENPAAGIRYFLVKPSDVAIYVEHGAADVGIVGRDILEESTADVYELLDTGLGKCDMCVAGPADYEEHPDRTLRVATKFVDVAKRHFAAQGRDIDIIRLNGSIELAPLLGLSDVIVDIVETGSTLRENNLKVLERFLPISARFIANRVSYQFQNREITELLEKLSEVIGQ